VGSLLTEVGGFRKRRARLRIALVYPNTYKVGMASLGFHTVYSLLNSYEDVACERLFLGMKTTIESGSPLSAFDVVGFSLQYELDFINMVSILDACGVERLRRDRAKPMVIAGGPCCVNPLPLTRIVDLFVVGDIEPVADRLVDGLLSGARPAEIASPNGLFCSELMNPTKAAKAMDMDSIPAPTNQPHPTTSGFRPALGSTFMVEISRGCNVRCRFCMYSHCSHPKRERSLLRIREIVEEGLTVTGLAKVSLIGALVTDHSQIKEILAYLVEKGVSVSLPSIRTDEVDDEMLELIGQLGIRTITVAPEGSPHIRSILKKDLGEEGLRYVTDSAFEHGVRKLRLYFITGVPGETSEDLEYIADLCLELSKRYGGRGAVTASVNPLVPKPHAPTQFLPMADPRTIEGNYRFLRKALGPRVDLKLQSIKESIIQTYLALGREKTGGVLLQASGAGLGLAAWRRIAESEGDPLSRVFRGATATPWDLIDSGLPQTYLQRQHREMIAARNATAAPSGNH